MTLSRDKEFLLECFPFVIIGEVFLSFLIPFLKESTRLTWTTDDVCPDCVEMASSSLAACLGIVAAKTSSAVTDAHLAHVVGPAGELFPHATAPLSFLHCVSDGFLRLPSDVSCSIKFIDVIMV